MTENMDEDEFGLDKDDESVLTSRKPVCTLLALFDSEEFKCARLHEN